MFDDHADISEHVGRSFDRVVDCDGAPARRRDGKGGTQPTALQEDVALAVAQRVEHASPDGAYGGRISVPGRISVKCSEFERTPCLDAGAYLDHLVHGRRASPEYVTAEFVWDSVHRPRYDEASLPPDAEDWLDAADVAVCDETGRPVSLNGRTFERVRGGGLLVAQEGGGSCTLASGVAVRHPYARDGVRDTYAELAAKQVYAGLAERPLLLYGQRWTDCDLRSSSVMHHEHVYPGDARWGLVDLYREAGVVRAALVRSEPAPEDAWTPLEGLSTALALEDDLPDQRRAIRAWWQPGATADDGVLLKVGDGIADITFATTVPATRLSDLFPLVQAHLRYDSRRAATRRALDCFHAGGALRASVSKLVPLGLRIEIDLIARMWSGEAHWDYRGHER